MASGPCARILNALKDCKRKHPRDPVSDRARAFAAPPPPGKTSCRPPPIARAGRRARARAGDKRRSSSSRSARQTHAHRPAPSPPPPPPSNPQQPQHQQFVCQNLTASAGWCMWSNLCPEEVRGIEDCIGVSSTSAAPRGIPPRCATKVALLEACIEAHQLLADERTDRCTGPQPVRDGPGAAAAAAGGGGAAGEGGAGGGGNSGRA